MTIVRVMLLLATLGLAEFAYAEPAATTPAKTAPATAAARKRPEWLERDGIVMGGSWEPLSFRIKRDGTGDKPTAEQLAEWRRGHSQEIIDEMKAKGVNFVLIHNYKGSGLKVEQQEMQDAVAFTKLCHENGIHVGVYAYSGAFLWENFFKEMPQAKDWLLLNRDGKPQRYGGRYYRYFWDRNHPEAQEFYRGLVRFAVNDVKTDMVHFDNYVLGPGFDKNSIKRFRRYLSDTFSPEELVKMGVADVNKAKPPKYKANKIYNYAWAEFCCASLAESYHDMMNYSRSLNPDMLVICNPRGPFREIYVPIDHGRLLQGGDGYFDESDDDYRRIRTYKVGRLMNNMGMNYTRTPLACAESMAFNLDCLGVICWFEYGQLTAIYGDAKPPMLASLDPYVKFFKAHRDLLGKNQVVADVAVLRSFPSQVFGGKGYSDLTARAEELLIDNRGSFQIIYDQQLSDLKRYKALVLAGCVAMSDENAEKIRGFVKAGGKLCVIGDLATHDKWMQPRSKPALDDLPAESVIRIAAKGDWLAGIRTAVGGDFSMSIPFDSPKLRAEITEQPNRRMVHLVNYDENKPALQVPVAVRLPAGRQVESVTLVGPDHEADIPLEFKQDGNVVSATVPEVNIYEIVVVQYAASDK